jgi:CMP-N-acetylneuraminic acid synthetase
MLNGKKFIGIIPARAGSKGFPGKNIKNLSGKPLVVWSIEQALKSKYLDRVFVSTDGNDIADIAKNAGINIPFLRPAEIANDTSPTSEAVLHTLDVFEQSGEVFDYIVLLEPTSPLRKKNDIDDAIERIVQHSDAECLVSVGEVHMEHPQIVKTIIGGYVSPYLNKDINIYQRQQADKVYFPYGVIYISMVSAFKATRTFYTSKTIPYPIERWQNYEIDDGIDFMIVETILQKYKEQIYG